MIFSARKRRFGAPFTEEASFQCLQSVQCTLLQWHSWIQQTPSKTHQKVESIGVFLIECVQLECLRPEEESVLRILTKEGLGTEEIPDNIVKQYALHFPQCHCVCLLSRVCRTPQLHNLLRTLSYHYRCMTQLSMDSDGARKSQKIVSQLAEIVRTLLCL